MREWDWSDRRTPPLDLKNKLKKKKKNNIEAQEEH